MVSEFCSVSLLRDPLPRAFTFQNSIVLVTTTSAWTDCKTFVILLHERSGYTDRAFSKTMELVGQAVVTLIVGSSKTSFYIDKALLCGYVAFFNKAFNGKFKEAQNSLMELPDENPGTVQNFVRWLHDGLSMDFLALEYDISPEELLELFMLAEKWMLDDLQEEAYQKMDLVFSFIENVEVCRRYWRLARDSRIRFIPLLAYAQCLAKSIDEGYKGYTILKPLGTRSIFFRILHFARPSLTYHETRNSLCYRATYKNFSTASGEVSSIGSLATHQSRGQAQVIVTSMG